MVDPISWQRRLRPLLAPLGRVYGAVAAVRRRAYESGLLTRWSAPAPCVSVGNIGWGGSGKTPLVGWLAAWAVERELRPCILTRGYRARPPHLPYLVTPQSPAAEAGDEPLLLARTAPGAQVVVDPVRARSGPWAVGRFGPRLFLLDDGFQHLAAGRDADLVLLRPEDLEGEWNQVIPAGSWRESRHALARAAAFLVKATPERFEALLPLLRRRLRPLGCPVFSFFLRATGLARAISYAGAGADACPPDRERAPGVGVPAAVRLTAAETARVAPYALVTGVGSPAQVADTARGLLGTAPVRHFAFPDHHDFSAADWRATVLEAERSGARTLVCTPKDAVKLAPVADARLAVLTLETVFGPSLDEAGELTQRAFPAWWELEWRRISSRKR